MKNSLAAFVVGLIFALGLGLSGMTQPAKVIGFLDIFGDWDPSLVFVMIGAIGIHAIAYRIILKRPSPLFASKWYLPSQTAVNAPLIIGSVIFGMGWGLAGYCPGPAVVSLGSLEMRPFLFVGSMLLGMLILRLTQKKATVEPQFARTEV